MSHTLLIGTDFRRSSIKMRERVHFDDEIKPAVIKHILNLGGISEAVLLTTCNRVEIYLVAENPKLAKNIIFEYLATFHHISKETLHDKMYVVNCKDAAEHLFKVASGLESMVIGETQILGQLKSAYELSKKVGGCGPILNKLFQSAIATGKWARKSTTINTGITSIGSAAAKLAIELAPQDGTFAVIGCGEMGSIVAKNIVKEGFENIILCNKTKSKGEALAKELGVSFIPLEKVDEVFERADVVVTALKSVYCFCHPRESGDPEHLITLDSCFRRNDKSSSTPFRFLNDVKIIDIGTPRNIDPEIGKLPNVTLYTIDDLKEIIDKNITLRKSAMEDVEKNIEEKIETFTKWYCSRNQYGKEINNRDPRIEAGSYTGKLD